MTSSRSKGLGYVREVIKLLEGMNHAVEGPGYASKWFNGRVNVVHKDYFNLFDLISYCDGVYYLHQVSDLSHKAEKVKAIKEKHFPGWVWCRTSEAGRIKYRLFFVQSDGTVEEGEIRFLH